MQDRQDRQDRHASRHSWPDKGPRYSICYMGEDKELAESLARVAAETDQLRLRASSSLREAVGKAADRGLTQKEIGRAIGRSQPEVSRLIRAYRATRFRPTSPLGRILARNRDEIVALAHAHKASNVRVFGSVVRGEDDDASDIDLLVDLDPGADLLDLAALDIELERLLGRPVDIVPTRLLKPHVAAAALADAVEL
jgi:predicted nucleotidyltransferase